MLAGGGSELMSSRKHSSEDALAELGCQHLTEQSRACLLIGRLSMGFTLAAALGQLGDDAPDGLNHHDNNWLYSPEWFHAKAGAGTSTRPP